MKSLGVREERRRILGVSRRCTRAGNPGEEWSQEKSECELAGFPWGGGVGRRINVSKNSVEDSLAVKNGLQVRFSVFF